MANRRMLSDWLVDRARAVWIMSGLFVGIRWVIEAYHVAHGWLFSGE